MHFQMVRSRSLSLVLISVISLTYFDKWLSNAFYIIPLQRPDDPIMNPDYNYLIEVRKPILSVADDLDVDSDEEIGGKIIDSFTEEGNINDAIDNDAFALFIENVYDYLSRAYANLQNEKTTRILAEGERQLKANEKANALLDVEDAIVAQAKDKLEADITKANQVALAQHKASRQKRNLDERAQALLLAELEANRQRIEDENELLERKKQEDLLNDGLDYIERAKLLRHLLREKRSLQTTNNDFDEISVPLGLNLPEVSIIPEDNEVVETYVIEEPDDEAIVSLDKNDLIPLNHY